VRQPRRKVRTFHIRMATRYREIDLILNTPYGKQQRADDSSIRSAAVSAGIPCITTLAGIGAIVSALGALRRGPPGIRTLQEYHRERAV